MNRRAGDRLDPLVKPPITRDQLIAYAHASGDINPIHLDEKFARKAGFPSVIAHGMLSMAFIADFLRHHFPDDSYRLEHLRARFRKVTFPGDSLSCGGRIRAVNDDGTFFVEAATTNQGGEITTEAEARFTPRSS